MGKIDKYIRDNCILSDKPVTGSSYITPDGKFVDLVNSGFRSHGALDERMLEDEVITLDELMGKTATPIRFENYVRVNDGKNFFSELVIDLPKNRLSIDQIYGIVDWLDFLIENHKEYVTIGSDLRGIRPVTYYFNETSTEDILRRIRRFQSSGTLYESVDLVEKILYRGETDRTFSKSRKAFAGLFFGPTATSVKGWGTPTKYTLDSKAKIFEYSSSDAYCYDNGLYEKRYKELSVFSEYADIQTLSYFTSLDEDERKELNDKVEQIAGKAFCWYDLWTWCLQLVAKIELENKGYDGVFWKSEDAGNPKQYQIWNMSVISRCQNENLNEDLVSVNAAVFNSTDTKLDAICKEYEGCKFIPMRRDACMAINRQMIYYLNEKGYYDIKIVGGLFKVDKLDWVDKNDFSKSEIAEIYQTYGNTTKASLLKYLDSLPEEKRAEFYYIPHWWCELPDGTIVDAAWRMFKKYISNVSIDNYVEFENITDLQSYCGNNVKNLKTSKYIIGKKSQDLVESSKETEYNIIEMDKKFKQFIWDWMDSPAWVNREPNVNIAEQEWNEAQSLGFDTYKDYAEYKKEQSKAPVNVPLRRKLVTEGQKTKSKYRFVFYNMNQFQALFDEKNAYDGHTNFMYALNHVDRLERDVIAESEEEAYKLFRKDHSEKVFEIEEVIYIGKVKVDN